MKKILPLVACVSLVSLSACVNQQMADEKMGKGCEAAIAAAIAPKTIKETKAINFSDEQADNTTFRRVAVSFVEKDDFVELDKEFSCLFAQNWGVFNTSHTAVLEQISIDDKMMGNKDGEMVGSLDDFMKIVDAAAAAMEQ